MPSDRQAIELSAKQYDTYTALCPNSHVALCSYVSQDSDEMKELHLELSVMYHLTWVTGALDMLLGLIFYLVSPSSLGIDDLEDDSHFGYVATILARSPPRVLVAF